MNITGSLTDPHTGNTVSGSGAISVSSAHNSIKLAKGNDGWYLWNPTIYFNAANTWTGEKYLLI